MSRQPDDRTCGAACLHALYRHHGHDLPLGQLAEQIRQLPTGGTLGVHLANHALARGFEADLFTYNLKMFDPTWFAGTTDLEQRLREQQRLKGPDPRLDEATEAYLSFIGLGGRLRFQDLGVSLLQQLFRERQPLLVGLSATYLYSSMREHPETEEADDLRGEPAGHFVLLLGYDPESRQVSVADPYVPNPLSEGPTYRVGVDRILSSILLGVLTYDANLVLLRPGGPGRA